MSINARILKIIEVKASGKQRVFAEMLGWSPQYVQKLTKEGGSVGIEPVSKLLNHFEDINARWLITGKGQMIGECGILEIKNNLYQNIQMLMEIEKYLPYMTDEELETYRQSANDLSKLQVEKKQIERWQGLLIKNEEDLMPKKKIRRTQDAG